MRWLAALFACFSTLCSASSTTTDFSDLWNNPQEAGWGVNVIQQRNTLFMTLFVYGTDGTPEWYVASDVQLVDTSNGVFTFVGALYRTSGPYFGAATFNPNQVGVVEVGAIAFVTGEVARAGLAYNVGNVTVQKSIERQTWARENLGAPAAGQPAVYVGASIGTWSNCASGNGPTEDRATYTVTQTDVDASTSNVRIVEEGAGYSCTYNGAYTQTGRFGVIQGTATCSDGSSQQFVASEVLVSLDALTMRLLATQSGGCRFTGRMGGMRR